MTAKPPVRPMVEYASYYAEEGFPVFPIAKGTKEPLAGSHGFKDATTDEATIQRWWSEHPDADIGIPTGAETFDTLDVDPRHGGNESLATLTNGNGLPEGPSASTGGGGTHHLFSHIEGLGAASALGSIGNRQEATSS